MDTDSREERLFYIQKCAAEFWSVEKLKYNLRSDLYAREGKIANNFSAMIPDADFRGKALRSFKDEYLLDYINIEDPDEADERVLENHIVLNIKKVIMTMESDFSFIGNQYRVAVADKEYFIDLLFFNRQLQSLVAVELLCCAQHKSSIRTRPTASNPTPPCARCSTASTTTSRGGMGC